MATSRVQRSASPNSGLRSLDEQYQLDTCMDRDTGLWRAWDRHNMRPVAIRILESFDLTEQEWRALSSLSHPRIVTLLDRGLIRDPSDGVTRPFVCVEHVEARPLKCEMTVLTLEDALTVFNDCCEALAAAHGAGVIHGDLKPGSILVSRVKGRINWAKVINFGLKRRSVPKNGHKVVGSGAYTAPEQTAGEPPSGASDVFSIGVIAYEMLCHRHPFASIGDHVSFDLLNVQAGRIVPAAIADVSPQVPDNVVWLVHRALASQPKDRPTAQDLSNLLKAKRIFERERRESQTRLHAIAEMFERGDLQLASEQLRADLEIPGWAFPEIVHLRHQIDASLDDRRIANAVAHDMECLKRNDLTGWLNSIRYVEEDIPARRFDVRLLRVEAEADVRAAELAGQEGLLREAQEAARQGNHRRAVWALDRLQCHNACDPFQVGQFSSEADALKAAIHATREAQIEWLRRARELKGKGQPSGILNLDAGFDEPIPQTDAIVAEKLLAQAKLRKEIFQRSLDLLDEHSPDEHRRLADEVRSLLGTDDEDPVRTILRLSNKRDEIIARLLTDLEQHEAAGLVAEALQAAETLCEIAPDSGYESKTQLLAGLYDREMTEYRRQRWVHGVLCLVLIGDLDAAETMVAQAVDEFPSCPRLAELRDRIAQHQAHASENRELVQSLLGAEKLDDHHAALEVLRQLAGRNSGNIVLEVALAARLIEESRRARMRDEEAASLDLHDEAAGLLTRHTDSCILADARSKLGSALVPQPLPPETRTPPTPATGPTPARLPARPESHTHSLPSPERARPWAGKWYEPVISLVHEVGEVLRLMVSNAKIRARELFTSDLEDSPTTKRPAKLSPTTVRVIGGLLGAVLVAALAYQFVGRRGSGQPAKATARTAVVRISLEPPEASLKIDGKAAASGQVTLSLGPHTLDATVPGYHPIHRNLDVSSDDQKISLVLEAIPVGVTAQTNLENLSIDATPVIGLSGAIQRCGDVVHEVLITGGRTSGPTRISMRCGAAQLPKIEGVTPAPGVLVHAIAQYQDTVEISSSSANLPVFINLAKQASVRTGLGRIPLNGLFAQGDSATVQIGEGRAAHRFTIQRGQGPAVQLLAWAGPELGAIVVRANVDGAHITYQPPGTQKKIQVKQPTERGVTTIPSLPSGSYLVSIAKPGYCEQPPTKAEVQEGLQATASFTLKAYPSLQITNWPLDGTLRLDNQLMPSSDGRWREIPPGRHTVFFRAAGYREISRVIDFQCGDPPVTVRAEKLPVTAPPSTPATGKATFSVEPPESTVVVLSSGGVVIVPQGGTLELAPGTYQLRVSLDRFKTVEKEFSIRRGETVSLGVVNLEKLPEDRPAWIPSLSSPAGSGWQKAVQRVSYGAKGASGVYEFRIKGSGKKLGIFGKPKYDGWLIGGIEYEVNGGALRYRESSSSEWNKVSERSIATRAESITVRIRIIGNEAECFVDGARIGTAPVGDGPFGLTSGTEIQAFKHMP